jgi:hypothetical protein
LIRDDPFDRLDQAVLRSPRRVESLSEPIDALMVV